MPSIMELLQSGAFDAVPDAEKLVNALPSEGAGWLADRALTADSITPTQLSQFGEYYNTLHPDPAAWSGPAANPLAGLSAGGFELNPRGFGDTVMDDLGNITVNPYDNAQALQQIRSGAQGYDLSRFADPRVDAWYAAHPGGSDDPTAQFQRMLEAIPDAGQGSPLGGAFTLRERREAGKFAPSGPEKFYAGEELPSTNNWMLLPPNWRQPGMMFRNGWLIDSFSPGYKTGYPAWGFGNLPPTKTSGGFSQGSGAGYGYPAAYSPNGGREAAISMGLVGWPGSLREWVPG